MRVRIQIVIFLLVILCINSFLEKDLESAIIIEEKWKHDGLKVYKPKYNVLLSYPDNETPNR